MSIVFDEFWQLEVETIEKMATGEGNYQKLHIYKISVAIAFWVYLLLSEDLARLSAQASRAHCLSSFRNRRRRCNCASQFESFASHITINEKEVNAVMSIKLCAMKHGPPQYVHSAIVCLTIWSTLLTLPLIPLQKCIIKTGHHFHFWVIVDVR